MNQKELYKINLEIKYLFVDRFFLGLPPERRLR